MSAPTCNPMAHTAIEVYRFGGWSADGQFAHCDACNDDLAGSLWTTGSTLGQVVWELRRRFRSLGEVYPGAGGPFDALATIEGAPSLHGGYFGLYVAEDARHYAVAVAAGA